MSTAKTISIRGVSIMGEYSIPVSQISLDTIEYFQVPSYSCIPEHMHNDQWEVWTTELPEALVLPGKPRKKAYICPKGESHALINSSNLAINVSAFKGNSSHTYEDLANFWKDAGFSPEHGSLIIMGVTKK